MSEENKQAQPSEEQVKEPEKKELNIEDRIAEIEKNLEAKYKSQIAGLDKKVSEQSKKLEEAELAKLDEKTRAAEEIRIAQEERDRIKNETEALRRERLIEKALIEAGLDPKFSDRIKGKEPEEIAEDVKNFKEFLSGEAKRISEAEINARLGGEKPKSGETATPAKMTLEEIEKLPPGSPERKKALKEAGYL